MIWVRFLDSGLATASSYALVLLAATLLPGNSEASEPPEFRIFGHLTQAYGWSDHGSIRGTTEDGTSDLRNLAIQFRWQKSERETVVIQFSHERRGQDFLFPDEDEIEVDWAFYQRQIGANTELKVGRLNVPLGIYNEIRDVGTLLPFFDVPVSFYAGVLSSAETVDGISIARTFAPRSEWDLDTTLYFGGWKTFEQQLDPDARFQVTNLEARAENGVGVQFWLNTPASGVRIGAGFLTWQLEGPLSGPGVKHRWKSAHFSLDAVREKWMVRGEVRQWRFDQDIGAFLKLPSLSAQSERDSFYLQVGTWITPRVGIFAQHEDIALRDDSGLIGDLEDFYEDLAVSLNYRWRPDLLVKIEFHTSDTFIPLGLPVRTRRIAIDDEALGLDIEPGDYVELTVSDTGCGMTEESSLQIFEPFYTTKVLGRGTGLGLSTVYGIVTQTGGAIEVESAVDRGTTVRVLLPGVEASLEAKPDREPQPAIKERSATVLVVEDEGAVRRLAERALAKSGFRVLTASSGEEALEISSAHGGAIDLLVTDVMMPEMDGLELASIVSSSFPGLPVLFMSGYPTTTLRERHTELPQSTPLLQKPFTASTLVREARRLLEPS